MLFTGFRRPIYGEMFALGLTNNIRPTAISETLGKYGSTSQPVNNYISYMAQSDHTL